MEKKEGARYVGAVIVLKSLRFQILSHDYARSVFVVRNVYAKWEDEITTRQFEDALADGIITVEKRRRA